jgi:hypothetical protein
MALEVDFLKYNDLWKIFIAKGSDIKRDTLQCNVKKWLVLQIVITVKKIGLAEKILILISN